MKIDIVHSTTDIAGVNLRAAMDRLIKHAPAGGWPLLNTHEVTFHTIHDRIINATDAVTSPDAELVIFLARHSSVNPVPVLTVHPAGNYTTADLGGNPGELGLAAPAWMREILRNHQKYAPEEYRISYEITHHGPTNIHAPYFFVEVGSTETEWRDSAAVEAAATSVLMAAPSGTEQILPLIGFGGTHYAARQTAIALDTNGAFGHMMHTRNVAGVDEAMIRQMIEKSGAIAAHIDKKALSKQENHHLEGILAKIGIPELSEGDLHKLLNMSWPTWKKFTNLAEETGRELKLFPHGTIRDGEPVSLELPEDLFNAAFSGNEDILFQKLDAIGNVFHTTNRSGKLLPLLFTITDSRREIAGDLIALSVQQVTRTKGTTVDGNRITITRRQFEPGLARTLGLRSGPLYGKLVAGESVTLPDGRTITPDMVTRTTQSTIHIPGLENYS